MPWLCFLSSTVRHTSSNIDFLVASTSSVPSIFLQSIKPEHFSATIGVGSAKYSSLATERSLHMLQKSMILDTISYSLVVFAKVKMGDLTAAKEIYEEMLKRGFRENAFVCSLFVRAYCDEGRVDEAIGIFKEIEQLGFKPSAETFSHLIKVCSLEGKLEDSLEFCKHMMRIGLLPCSSAVNVMFGKLCENGETRAADEMLTLLLEKGFAADEDTYSHLVSGYCRADDKEGLVKLLGEMQYKSISPSEHLSSAIIRLCREVSGCNGNSLARLQ